MNEVTIIGVAIGQLELLAGGIGTAVAWTLLYRIGTRGRRFR